MAKVAEAIAIGIGPQADQATVNADVRDAMCSVSSWLSALMISSVIPSAKYSLSGSALRFLNGSTATDAASAFTSVPDDGIAPVDGNPPLGVTIASSRRTTSSRVCGRDAASFSRHCITSCLN